MNGPKREHHIIPRLYLKGFVIAPGEPFIWVYRRGEEFNPGSGRNTNNPFRDSINSAGSERDYYAIPGLTGRERFELFENELEAFEKPANPILEKLRNFQAISEEEKRTFATYMIHMSRRVSAGRAMTNSLWPKVAEEYEPPEALYHLKGWAKTPENRCRLKAEAMSITEKPGYAIHMHRGGVHAAHESLMTEALKLMTWHFFKAPTGKSFLTGDNPVFFEQTVGLASSVAEVSFPISSDLALVALWWKLPIQPFAAVPDVVVDEINRRTMHNASKYLYFSKCERWVCDVFGKSTYKYRPMYAPKSDFKVVEIVSGDQHSGRSLRLNVQLPLIPPL